MLQPGEAVRVTIYISESARVGGKPLLPTLLAWLKEHGAAGATVWRAGAGFGAHGRIHTTTLVDLATDLPVCIHWIDRPDVVDRLLPGVQRLVHDGLITREAITVVQAAAPGAAEPLVQTVGDIMQRSVVTVTPTTPVADIVTRLLAHGTRSVAVVDDAGHVAGVITDGDLLRRGGLHARLDLQTTLAEEAIHGQLAALRRSAHTAADVMTAPPVTVSADATLQDAARRMVEGDLKRLPAVDADGRLVGWISRVDILRAWAAHHAPLDDAAEPPPPGSRVVDLMYHDVPLVPPDASAEIVLQALEHNRRRRAVVIDSFGRPLGIITDGDLLRHAERRRPPGLLARLRSLVTGHPADAPSPLPVDLTADAIMTWPAVTVAVDETPAAALARMLQHQVKRLPVVDADGRVIGLLGRATLLRAFLADAG